jgi:hypothetical protein
VATEIEEAATAGGGGSETEDATKSGRGPSENTVQATRRRRSVPGARPEEPKLSTPLPPAPGAVNSSSTATDPWTVPQSVRDRFVQDGNRFYFPDGALAIRDRGRKLATPSENTEVIRSLIEIAQSRRWSEITVGGTERFRQEAWRQGRLGGLSVRGYQPSDEERAQLIRALGKSLPSTPERTAGAEDSQASPAAAPRQADRQPLRDKPNRFAGRLLKHGADAYRHDPNQQPSYFVKLQTEQGTREYWGKDLERAVVRSLSHPQIGDEVILQRAGRDAVTVRRQARSEGGAETERELETFRNRWVLEKREFIDQRATAAGVVRQDTIAPRHAVESHPELAGTYAALRAAELISRRFTESRDRSTFVARVREGLADQIERGGSLPSVKVRSRLRPPPSKPRDLPNLER